LDGKLAKLAHVRNALGMPDTEPAFAEDSSETLRPSIDTLVHQAHQVDVLLGNLASALEAMNGTHEGDDDETSDEDSDSDSDSDGYDNGGEDGSDSDGGMEYPNKRLLLPCTRSKAPVKMQGAAKACCVLAPAKMTALSRPRKRGPGTVPLNTQHIGRSGPQTYPNACAWVAPRMTSPSRQAAVLRGVTVVKASS
jgi:hypothetical protein